MCATYCCICFREIPKAEGAAKGYDKVLCRSCGKNPDLALFRVKVERVLRNTHYSYEALEKLGFVDKSCSELGCDD